MVQRLLGLSFLWGSFWLLSPCEFWVREALLKNKWHTQPWFHNRDSSVASMRKSRGPYEGQSLSPISPGPTPLTSHLSSPPKVKINKHICSFESRALAEPSIFCHSHKPFSVRSCLLWEVVVTDQQALNIRKRVLIILGRKNRVFIWPRYRDSKVMCFSGWGLLEKWGEKRITLREITYFIFFFLEQCRR